MCGLCEGKVKTHNKDQQKRTGILLIEPEVLSFIEEEATRTKGTETGGVIAGRGSFESKLVIVSKASDAGPNAVKRRYFFSRDTGYCQKLLDTWASESDGKVDYLGEWHKHLEIEPRASSTDIQTMRRIAASSQYHINIALLLIIGESNHRDSLKAFLINKDGMLYPIRWIDSNLWKGDQQGN